MLQQEMQVLPKPQLCPSKTGLAIKHIWSRKSSAKVQLKYIYGGQNFTRAELGKPKCLTLTTETLTLTLSPKH